MSCIRKSSLEETLGRGTTQKNPGEGRLGASCTALHISGQKHQKNSGNTKTTELNEAMWRGGGRGAHTVPEPLASHVRLPAGTEAALF